MEQEYSNDAMIRRLERELEERNAHKNGIIRAAQDDERDLTDSEKGQLGDIANRMKDIQGQLELLGNTANIAAQIHERSKELDATLTRTRKGMAESHEYRSAGAWATDSYLATLNLPESRAARERLEAFERAAAHQKTSDNLGLIPDPVIGSVINFVDSTRPLVSFLGAQPMPSANWHRPKVTQHVTVAKQGSAGAAADEKSELVSQKMTITRLDGSAVTYGGYVNVSRQDIDFSSPSALDAVVNDLAAQYAIQTEAATAAVFTAASQTQELTGAAGNLNTLPATAFVEGIWKAAGTVFNATKGAGRLAVAISADVLGVFGQAFSPYNPQNQQGSGFSAASFGQGIMGTISGIPVILSSGFASNTAIVFSTAAVEVYEQKVGMLQVTEPSVLGVQVAYAGYFTPMTVESTGIVKLVNAA